MKTLISVAVLVPVVLSSGGVVGHHKISSIHGGCTLFEEYNAENSGDEGESFNYFDPGDGTITDRITWHHNADGTVRQVWDVSKDGGKTWTNVFDGLYERKE